MAKNDPDYWEGMANLYLDRAIKAEATIAKLEAENKRLQQDSDFLIKHAHHIDDMNEIAVLKATIAKLEGENKELIEDNKILMGNTNAAIEDYNDSLATIATLQGKLDRALIVLKGYARYDGYIGENARSILSDLSPKDQGHE